jgi:hypothetical protein
MTNERVLVDMVMTQLRRIATNILNATEDQPRQIGR